METSLKREIDPPGDGARPAALAPAWDGRRGVERAVLVGVSLGAAQRARALLALDELKQLAESAGARVVGRLLQERRRFDPATLVGRGKLDEIAQLAADSQADLVIFDENLSPGQQRNLEEALGCRTVDRTQLILDIFARRAQTREGRLQVELAQLTYLLPRLTGKGVLLSRLGGGIGTRGPGETKLETDRRRIRQRIQAVRRAIEAVQRRRHTRREARERRAWPIVALVGYTNAGKSTLFNALTDSVASVSDQLFVTLDPLVRRCSLGGGQQILLVDTVGFIAKLPHGLVSAFRATLEEVAEADLLLHVSDASADDREAREAAVAATLNEIGAGQIPCIRVLNKVDRLDPARRAALAVARVPGISALTGEGLAEVRRALVAQLDLDLRRVRLRFGRDDRQSIASVYASGRVVARVEDGDTVMIDADLPARCVGRYRENVR